MTNSNTESQEEEPKIGTFWDHLDVLRGCIIKIIVVTVALGMVCFCFKTQLFDVVLAPRETKFITYQLLGLHPETIHLMNIGLTEQFMVHMKTALYAGVLLASPYILYQIFCFVSPGLYDNERRYAVKLVGGAYIMFMIGTLLNYFIIFPMTVRFLGTYQVDPSVANMLTLQSYIETLLMMNLVMGIIFELPVVCWLLARLGLINAHFMRKFRRHAVIAILVISAIITPTTDVFTLSLVSVPIWLLYEISIIIVARSYMARKLELDEDDDEDDEEPKTELPEKVAESGDENSQTEDIASPTTETVPPPEETTVAMRTKTSKTKRLAGNRKHKQHRKR